MVKEFLLACHRPRLLTLCKGGLIRRMSKDIDPLPETKEKKQNKKKQDSSET